MSNQLTSFLLAVLLGVVSCAIAFALYRYGQAYVKYKGARFGGAVAIAGVAFYLMSNFYFRQLGETERSRQDAMFNLRAAVTEYETCVAQEKGTREMACKYQADSLRDAANALLH